MGRIVRLTGKWLAGQIVLAGDIGGDEKGVIFGHAQLEVPGAGLDPVGVVIKHNPNLEIGLRCYRPNGQNNIAVDVLDPQLTVRDPVVFIRQGEFKRKRNKRLTAAHRVLGVAGEPQGRGQIGMADFDQRDKDPLPGVGAIDGIFENRGNLPGPSCHLHLQPHGQNVLKRTDQRDFRILGKLHDRRLGLVERMGPVEIMNAAE